MARSFGVPVFELAPGVFERVANTVTPQPVMAVVPMTLTSVSDFAPGLVVVLADVRDPGNAGTLIRTAEAAGASGVVLAGDAVDPFNPKTVRSSAGTMLWSALSVARDLRSCLLELRSLGFTLRGTEATGGIPYDDAPWAGNVALVLGNEAHGLDDASKALLDDTVTITMAGAAESLNVSVAGAVLCFEALRQRRNAS
jgi:TrmH family RNA methyltransferase